MGEKCSDNKAIESACKEVNNEGETELCTFTEGENTDSNTCLTNEVSISGLFNTNTNKESQVNCKAIKYDGTLELCVYTAAVEATCKDIVLQHFQVHQQ